MWVIYPAFSVLNTTAPWSSFDSWILLPSAWFKCKKQKKTDSRFVWASEWMLTQLVEIKIMDLTENQVADTFFRFLITLHRKPNLPISFFQTSILSHLSFDKKDLSKSPTSFTLESQKKVFTLFLSLVLCSWADFSFNTLSSLFLPFFRAQLETLMFSCDFSLLSIVFNPTLIPSSSLPLHPAGLNGSLLV